jgi:hypothetical protein
VLCFVIIDTFLHHFALEYIRRHLGLVVSRRFASTPYKPLFWHFAVSALCFVIIDTFLRRFALE